MLLVDDLAAGGTKNLRHTPRGLVTLIYVIIHQNGKGQTMLHSKQKCIDYMRCDTGKGALRQ